MQYLKFEQILHADLDMAWDFFSSPSNLNILTPPDMKFSIKRDLDNFMYEGLLIEYKIKIFNLIPIKWVTEITHIKEKQYFIDEQRIGPYLIWHHEHHFEKHAEGVLMKDIIQYDIGKSIFGWIAGKLFVVKKVRGIFEFRKEVLESLFNIKD